MAVYVDINCTTKLCAFFFFFLNQNVYFRRKFYLGLGTTKYFIEATLRRIEKNSLTHIIAILDGKQQYNTLMQNDFLGLS